MSSEWERRKLLIWGTTYPEFSKKYFETVCTGAVDGETGRLLRIYPVTLRYMAEPFHQWSWIEAEVMRNSSDFRPESHKIRQDTMRVGESIGTRGDDWERRAQIVLREGNVFPSLEALRAAQENDRTSLGLVKPRLIRRVYSKPRPVGEKEEWERKRDEAAAQRDLLVGPENATRDLAFIPVEYHVEFTCDDPRCEGHDVSIRDWGTYLLGRKGFAEGGARQANRWVIDQVKKVMDPATRDSYFFLGNTMAHPQNFLVVGFFYPPRERQRLLL